MIDRRIAIRAGIGLAVVAAAIAFFTLYRGRPEAHPTGRAAAATTENWMRSVERLAKPGYWLVVRGTHIGDQVVAAGSAADLTHAALFDPSDGHVIEAVGTGVLVTPLRDLLEQSHRLQIIEPPDYSPERGAAAIERARGHVGWDYDFLGTIGLQSDRRFYCTELCVDAWRGREDGWMPDGVIHPRAMQTLGRVIFDEQRPSEQPLAAASDEAVARFGQVIEDARGVDYAAVVAPGLLRGGAPDEEGIAWLAEQGVRTVISLRPGGDALERSRVEAGGMRYISIPVLDPRHPDGSAINRFLEVVGDDTARPVYVHCTHGVHRTGPMIAAYRIQAEGWAAADALSEMDFFGARGLLDGAREFVDELGPR